VVNVLDFLMVRCHVSVILVKRCVLLQFYQMSLSCIMHALSLVFNSWAQSVPQVYTNDAVQRMYHGLHDGLVEVQDLSYRPYHFYHMMVTFVFAGY